MPHALCRAVNELLPRLHGHVGTRRATSPDTVPLRDPQTHGCLKDAHQICEHGTRQILTTVRRLWAGNAPRANSVA
jgi:hypothetical protein